MWEDRKWQQRVRLSNCLLLEAADWWCRTDSEFPVDGIVASVLRVFSPKFDPFGVSETGLRQHFLDTVGKSTAEYSLTWPHRADSQRSELIDTISRILSDAVNRWKDGGLSDPPIEMVNQQIIDQIVAQQYVMFHHNQTTRRDADGFYGSG
jgi:hypothetical protein